jgi:hypothetical protein
MSHNAKFVVIQVGVPAHGRYSIADIHLFRLYWRFANSLHSAWGIFSNLSAHFDRMIAPGGGGRPARSRAQLGTSCRSSGVSFRGPARPQRYL